MAEATIDLAAMASLVESMGRAASELRGRKASLSGILGGVSLDTSPPHPLETAAFWVDDQVPGLRRRLALAQQIAASNPGFHGAVTIDEAALSDLSPTEAASRGAEAARRIRRGGALDPELAGWLATYSTDPYFAAGLAGNVSPTELADYVQNLPSSYRLAEQNTASPTYAADLTAWQKSYQTLLTGLSQSLGTATRSDSPDLRLPTGYADTFAGAITDDGRPGHAAVLGLILRNGTFGTGFLDTVSTKVYDYERTGLAGTWASRAPQSWDPAPLDEHLRPLRCYDPLAGVMSALGRNAEASQHFFTGGGTEKVSINGKDLQVNTRLKYLVMDRTWSGDRWSDEGDGLGKALRSASITFRNREQSGQTSASIASQTLSLIGSRTGEGKEGGKWYLLGAGADNGWQMWTGMRDEVADIVADYLPDVFRVAGPEGINDDLGRHFVTRDSTFPADQPYGAALDKGLVGALLMTLGQDSANIDRITAGWAAANQTRLGKALDDQLAQDPRAALALLSGDRVDLVDNAAAEGPSVLGWIVDQAFTGDKADEDVARSRAEALSRALSLAAALPPLKITGEWASYAFGEAKDAALGELAKGPEASSSGLYGQMDDRSKENVQHAYLTMLLRHGYLDPSVYDGVNAQAGGLRVQPPPREALVFDAQGTPVGFAFDSPAYADWARTYGPTEEASRSTIDPYNRVFPNIR